MLFDEKTQTKLTFLGKQCEVQSPKTKLTKNTEEEVFTHTRLMKLIQKY